MTNSKTPTIIADEELDNLSGGSARLTETPDDPVATQNFKLEIVGLWSGGQQGSGGSNAEAAKLDE